MWFFSSRYSGLYEALLVAAVCAAASAVASAGGEFTTGEFNAFVGSCVCAVVASIYQRRLGPSLLPDGGLYALWALISTFSAFSILIFLMRLESSRQVVVVAFLASLTTMGALHLLRWAFWRPRFAAIPGGRFDIEDSNIPAQWFRLPDDFPALVLGETQHPDRFEAELTRHCGGFAVDGLVGDLHHHHSPEWQRLFVRSVMNSYPIFHFREVEEQFTGKISIDYLSENQFGSILPYRPYMHFKLAFEFLATLLLLPLLAGIVIMVAAAVYITSGRPVFYSQRRVGYRGRWFTIWKFRTMITEPRPEPESKSHGGPAGNSAKQLLARDRGSAELVTPIGRFLRRYRIDELPQFFNVLRGEMSWVGPRPEIVDLVELFRTKIRFYNYRHVVLPGITGWAQINQGHVSTQAEAVEKLRYDFYYLKHFSPWLDFVILVRTVRVIFGGKG